MISLAPEFLEDYRLTFAQLKSHWHPTWDHPVSRNTYKSAFSGAAVSIDVFFRLANQIAVHFAKEYNCAVTYGMLASSPNELGKSQRHQRAGKKYIEELDKLNLLHAPWFGDSDYANTSPGGNTGTADESASDSNTTPQVSNPPDSSEPHLEGTADLSAAENASKSESSDYSTRGRAIVAILIAVMAILSITFRSPSEPASPVRADLSVSVQPKDSNSLLPLFEAALPLTVGDSVRFDVTTSRSRYLYLVWLDPAGAVTPVYPSDGFKWSKSATQGLHDTVNFPTALDESFELVPDSEGIHSIILLVTDVPVRDFQEITRPLTLVDYRHDGLAVSDFELAVNMTDGKIPPPTNRFPMEFTHRRESKHPVMELRVAINELLARFETVQSVSFSFGIRVP